MSVSDVEDCAVAGTALEPRAVAVAGCVGAAFGVVFGDGFRFAVCGALGVDREADRLPLTAPVSLDFAGAAVVACASESEWAACESKLGCLREQPRMLVKAKATANDGESKLSCLRKLAGLFACECV